MCSVTVIIQFKLRHKMRTIHVAQKQRALPSHPFDVYCVWDKICAFALNIQIFSAHAHRKAHGGINVLNKYPYIHNFLLQHPSSVPSWQQAIKQMPKRPSATWTLRRAPPPN